MEKQITPLEMDCLDLIKRMLDGELNMTTEEKYIGMRELHRKYPYAGFGIKAEEFANNFLTKEKKERLPYTDDL